MDLGEEAIGKSIEVYVSHVKAKRNFVTLSLVPPAMRSKGKANNDKMEE
jgi:hypothetical protein